MVEEGLPEEERKVSSDMITSNSRALLGLLDDVLDLSRLEAGMDKMFFVFVIYIFGSFYVGYRAFKYGTRC